MESFPKTGQPKSDGSAVTAYIQDLQAIEVA